jgi:hypothetical protein
VSARASDERQQPANQPRPLPAMPSSALPLHALPWGSAGSYGSRDRAVHPVPPLPGAGRWPARMAWQRPPPADRVPAQPEVNRHFRKASHEIARHAASVQGTQERRPLSAADAHLAVATDCRTASVVLEKNRPLVPPVGWCSVLSGAGREIEVRDNGGVVTAAGGEVDREVAGQGWWRTF